MMHRDTRGETHRAKPCKLQKERRSEARAPDTHTHTHTHTHTAGMTHKQKFNKAPLESGKESEQLSEVKPDTARGG